MSKHVLRSIPSERIPKDNEQLAFQCTRCFSVFTKKGAKAAEFIIDCDLERSLLESFPESKPEVLVDV